MANYLQDCVGSTSDKRSFVFSNSFEPQGYVKRDEGTAVKSKSKGKNAA